VNFPLPPAGRRDGSPPEKKELLPVANSIRRPLATLPALRRVALQDGLRLAGWGFPLPLQRVAWTTFEAVANSIRRSHIAATSVTTFALGDMADFRRFVMTFCYDSPVFEVKNSKNPLLTRMVARTGIENVFAIFGKSSKSSYKHAVSMLPRVYWIIASGVL
jgi:hypothetical protein